MVPRAGIEPARSQWSRDFKSLVSTNFTIWADQNMFEEWRLGSESNRRTRSCSPLHDHSATQPYLYIQRGRTISKPRSMSMQWIKLLLLAVPGLKIICNMTYKPIFKFLGSVFLFTVMPNWNSRRAMIKWLRQGAVEHQQLAERSKSYLQIYYWEKLLFSSL